MTIKRSQVRQVTHGAGRRQDDDGGPAYLVTETPGEFIVLNEFDPYELGVRTRIEVGHWPLSLP